MRRIISLLLLFIVTLTLTACENPIMSRHEINDLEFARSIAIDTAKSIPDGVRLTLASQRIKIGSGGSVGEKESSKISSEGRTMFEAVRNFSTYLGKRPFWGHLEFVLIGEEAAKKGIHNYLDFFARDHEVRMNINVFVMKGCCAEELMEKADRGDRLIFDRLNGLLNSLGGQSVSNPVNLIEVMYIQDMKCLSLYIPCVEMVNVTKGQDEDVIDVKMAGFAIFDEDKLAGYLDENMGRGLNLLRNKVKSGIYVVNTRKGSKVSLEIINSKTKFYPEIKDGNLSLKVKVNMESNIGEIDSNEDIFNNDTFIYLEQEQSRLVKQEIERVIEYAQKEIGLDFFSTALNFYRKYPIKWKKLYEKDWKTWFPKIKFSVEVKSKIRRTYDIREPNAVEGEGGK
ncbi:MAG TPA: Ger(x)C family spore germination protein [Acetivibrio sp.]|nr:Ger(x)C family spore germination protein [Acetivibrio sp.]